MKFENKYFLARYLRGLWEKQKGKCAISGLELNKGNPMTIHIDREKGGRSSLYIENNIQLTMGIFNIAKNSNATEDFLIEMCRSIIHHIKKPSEHGQVLLQQLLEIKGELNIYNRQEEPGEIAERILTGKDMSKEE